MSVLTEPRSLANERLAQAAPYYAALGGLVVFHACVQALVIGLSILRVSFAAPVPQLVLLVSVAAGCCWWHWNKAPRIAVAETSRFSWLPKVLIAVAAFCYLLLWTPACLTYEATCDGNLYHLPTIGLWAEQGYVSWVDERFAFANYMNGYPKAVELLAFVLVKALGSDAVVRTANLAFLPLGALGIMLLSRLLGASRLLTSFAGMAWLLVPVNIFQATTLYVDAGYASCAVSFAATLVFAVLKLGLPTKTSMVRDAIVLGAAAGLAIGAKSSGIAFVAIGFVVPIIYSIALAFRQKRLAPVVALALPSITAACLCLAVGGFWYARNYLRTGTPLYPMGLSIAGRQVFPGLTMEQTILSRANVPERLRDLPAYQQLLSVWLQRQGWDSLYFYCDSRESGLGYFWPLGCVPAIVGLLGYWFYRREWLHFQTLLLLFGVVGGALLTQPMCWWPRYTVWVYTLGLPAFAVLTSRLTASRPDSRRLADEEMTVAASSWRNRWSASLVSVLRVWAAACMVVVAIEGWNCCHFVCTGLKAWPIRPTDLSKSIQARYRCSRLSSYWPELSGSVFDDIFAGFDNVAIGPLTHHPGTNEGKILGGLCDPAGRRRVLAMSRSPDKAAIDALLAEDVRFLIWDDGVPLPPALQESGLPMEKIHGFYVIRTEHKEHTGARTIFCR